MAEKKQKNTRRDRRSFQLLSYLSKVTTVLKVKVRETKILKQVSSLLKILRYLSSLLK